MLGREYETATNFLAFRPGEQFTIRNSPPNRISAEWERVYKVALVPTPPIKDSDLHSIHRDVAVVCAEFYPTKTTKGKSAWGWVHMEESTKKAIGYELGSAGASENEWFWMVLDTRAYYTLEVSKKP